MCVKKKILSGVIFIGYTYTSIQCFTFVAVIFPCECFIHYLNIKCYWLCQLPLHISVLVTIYYFLNFYYTWYISLFLPPLLPLPLTERALAFLSMSLLLNWDFIQDDLVMTNSGWYLFLPIYISCSFFKIIPKDAFVT